MQASGEQSTRGPVLLTLALGGALVAACCWSLAKESGEPSRLPSGPLAATGGSPQADLASGRFRDSAEAERSRREVQPRNAAESHRAPDSVPEELRTRRPNGERALRAHFLALEAREPGYLAAHAEEWLGGERSTASKVAWLQALREDDPDAALPWFEFACALDDRPTPQGEPASAFALGELARRATDEPAARAALARVAAAADSVDAALRRRAAATFAATAAAGEWDAFERALVSERDEALLAGVVVALENRVETDDAVAVARLLSWLRPGSAAYLARDERGDP